MAGYAVAREWEVLKWQFCPAFLYARPKSLPTNPTAPAHSLGYSPCSWLTLPPDNGRHIGRLLGSADPPTQSFGVVRASPPATFHPATPPPDPTTLGDADATPCVVIHPPPHRSARRLATFGRLATRGATQPRRRSGSYVSL